MQIPGIYTDIHISSDTVRIYTLYVYKYIWNVPRFLHYHSFKSAYFLGFLHTSTVNPQGQQLLSSQADPPERLFGSMIGRDRGDRKMCVVGSLWNWGFLVGCFAPFSSKGFFGIHYLTCNDHGKCYCFWDGGRLKLWDNARLSWWNGTVLPVLGWKTHHSCRWWKKIRELS